MTKLYDKIFFGGDFPCCLSHRCSDSCFLVQSVHPVVDTASSPASVDPPPPPSNIILNLFRVRMCPAEKCWGGLVLPNELQVEIAGWGFWINSLKGGELSWQLFCSFPSTVFLPETSVQH